MLSRVLVVLIAVGIIDCSIDGDFIQAYFQERFIRMGNVYTCGNKKDQVATFKSLMKLNIPISIHSIETKLEETLFENQDNHIGMILDANCPNLEAYFKQCNKLDIFDSKHHWIMLASTLSKLVLDRLHLNINSDLKFLENNWKIYDVFKASFKHKTELNVTYFGNYTKIDGIFVERKRKSLYEERRNMSGINFKSLVVLPEKFAGTLEEHIRSDEKLSINHFNRYHSLLHIYVADYFNFTIDFKMTDSWGYAMPNGTIDGVVGGLQRYEIDFGGSPLFMAEARYPIIDYGRRTWKLESAFIFRHPKRKASFEVFLRPLNKFAWITIAMAGLMVIILMKIIIRMEIVTFRSNRLADNLESTWSSLVLFVVGSLCQQGNPNLPLFISGRIVAVFFFVTSVLVYQFYSGSIVSFLLMQPQKTLKTVNQLAYSTLKLGSEDVLFAKIYFQQLSKNIVIVKLMNKRLDKYQFYLTPDVALPLVAKGGFAYHVELATAYPIIEKTYNEDQICDLEEIALFDAKPVMACFPKKSPFRDLFNFFLQKMDERGVMERQRKRYHAHKPECIRTRPKTSAVGMHEFYPALAILVIGMVVSFTVLIVEYIVVIVQHNWDDKKIIKPFTK